MTYPNIQKSSGIIVAFASPSNGIVINTDNHYNTEIGLIADDWTMSSFSPVETVNGYPTLRKDKEGLIVAFIAPFQGMIISTESPYSNPLGFISSEWNMNAFSLVDSPTDKMNNSLFAWHLINASVWGESVLVDGIYYEKTTSNLIDILEGIAKNIVENSVWRNMGVSVTEIANKFLLLENNRIRLLTEEDSTLSDKENDDMITEVCNLGYSLVCNIEQKLNKN